MLLLHSLTYKYIFILYKTINRRPSHRKTSLHQRSERRALVWHSTQRRKNEKKKKEKKKEENERKGDKKRKEIESGFRNFDD